MQPSSHQNETVLVTGLSNREFLERYAGPGLVREGLELVADRTRYSLRELVGTLIALRHSELRARTNLLARQRSMYCSALVNHVFRQAGLDLAPGVDLKNTTPEHIARTAAPH